MVMIKDCFLYDERGWLRWEQGQLRQVRRGQTTRCMMYRKCLIWKRRTFNSWNFPFAYFRFVFCFVQFYSRGFTKPYYIRHIIDNNISFRHFYVKSQSRKLLYKAEFLKYMSPIEQILKDCLLYYIMTLVSFFPVIFPTSQW